MPVPLEKMHAAIEAASVEVSDLTPDGLGWMIAMFDVGELGRLTYMATLPRDDMIKALRELIYALEREDEGRDERH